jgi:serine/threonine protein kinase
MIGGKYRPRDILGAGATGTVYSVEHAFTGELLALKVMKAHLGASADAITRFKREARAASKIRSQHVVRIFDADIAPELGGAPYLVMDLLEGSDLERLSDDKPVSAEHVVEWLRQLALPLDKAHAIGIIHRDLKPENIFLTRLDDGTPLVKILDFGIAKIVAESPATTQTGQLFGTPQYMAPEQARGDPTQVGPATDLFALGHVAYKLLTGDVYRTGTNLAEVLNEIVHGPLPAPSEKGYSFGPEFDRWFLRACHPDPALRFSSAHEQVEALARALGLPAGPELATAPPSGGARTSVPPVSQSLRPDSIRHTSLRAMGGEENAAISEKGADMPTSTVPGEERVEPVKQGGWRFAFVAASLLVGASILALAFMRARVPGGSPRLVACATDSVAAPVASGAPAPAPAPTQVATVLAMDLPVATTAARPSTADRDAVRSVSVRTSGPVAARAVVVRKGPTDDDPLSDQQ